MTDHLYYSDSYCTVFEARVTENLILNDSPAVVLDRTAFYPTGGGQPHDIGVLRMLLDQENEAPVMDVVAREEDHAIIHVLSHTELADRLSPGDQVQGEHDRYQSARD